MKKVTSNADIAAQKNRPEEEIRSRGGEKLPGKVSSPGGGGSRERVRAKGNDISHEDYLLQRDIADEVNNALGEDLNDEQ